MLDRRENMVVLQAVSEAPSQGFEVLTDEAVTTFVDELFDKTGCIVADYKNKLILPKDLVVVMVKIGSLGVGALSEFVMVSKRDSGRSVTGLKPDVNESIKDVTIEMSDGQPVVVSKEIATGNKLQVKNCVTPDAHLMSCSGTIEPDSICTKVAYAMSGIRFDIPDAYHTNGVLVY